MTGRRSTLLLLGAALVAVAALAVAALAGPSAPASLEERTEAVASSLRCPVCQNLSVADSDSPIAKEMREEIGERLRAGESPDEIRARFVAAYGEWILQAPPRRGLTWVVWLTPVAVLLAGAVVVAVALRRWTVRGAA